MPETRNVSVQHPDATAQDASEDPPAESAHGGSSMDTTTSIEASGNDAERERGHDVGAPTEAAREASARDAEQPVGIVCPSDYVPVAGQCVDAGPDGGCVWGMQCEKKWEGCKPNAGRAYAHEPDDAGRCLTNYELVDGWCQTPCGLLDWPSCGDNSTCLIGTFVGPGGIACCWHGPCYGSPPARLDLLA